MNGDLALIRANDDVNSVTLYLNEDHPLLEYSAKFAKMDSVANMENLVGNRESNSGSPWILWEDGQGEVSLSLFYNLYSTNDFSKGTAILRIDMDTDVVFSILENAANTSASQVVMFNSNNRVLLQTGNQGYDVGGSLDLLLGDDPLKPYSAKINLQGQEVFVSSLRSSISTWYRPDWTLISITPLSSVRAPIDGTMSSVLVVALISAVTFYGFACMFSFSLTSRITLLNKAVGAVQKGNFETMLTPKGHDEIRDLMANFNYMSKRIALLIKEQNSHANRLRENALVALKAQINPHFLYNTLDMINWSAMANNIPEISETVHSLSQFYKLSLNKGKTVVTLQDELSHVGAYMEIQQKRYEHIFAFSVSVPQELLPMSIVKITLQPLVENAILHGILNKQPRRGVLQIRARSEGEKLLISVYDDGVGFPQDRPDFTPPQENLSGKSYGLSNIHSSIQLYYGADYGIRIRSKRGEFTEVLVVLPLKPL